MYFNEISTTIAEHKTTSASKASMGKTLQHAGIITTVTL